MRQITPSLTSELSRHYGRTELAKAKPFPVRRYEDLVKHVARLAHLNPDHLLFFRGQTGDYANKAGASTFYPSIYRTDPLSRPEVRQRFVRLADLGRRLARIFRKNNMPGADEVAAREVLQWSIIQHYEIGLTPLLDLTHSLSVACSFAQDGASESEAYVYVFGFPHIANRISINSEHDIINIRLLSICPPDALRPYFQEGYLAGTWDVKHAYTDKSVLDFNRRLIAKFSIPAGAIFWGRRFGRIPREMLYPKADRVRKICERLHIEIEATLDPHDLGALLLEWQRIEQSLLAAATDRTRRVINAHRAIEVLRDDGTITPGLAEELQYVREWRNRVVHRSEQVRPDVIQQLLAVAGSLADALDAAINARRNAT